MHRLADRQFAAMNGLGNEILVVDMRGPGGSGRIGAAEIRAAAGQHSFDQLMTIDPAAEAGADAATRIFNRDGSQVEACGNGTRCVAWLLMRETGKAEVLLESAAGPLHCARSLLPDTVTVDMGMPRFAWDEIPLAAPVEDTSELDLSVEQDGVLLRAPAAVNVGNPHAVFWVDNPAAVDLGRIGRELETHPLFPERANISLAAITGPDHITLRVWERGAGLTRACGTAACAAAVLAARTKRTGRRVTVTLPGGPLFIEWRESDDHILMTGPVELEGEGRLSPELFAGAA